MQKLILTCLLFLAIGVGYGTAQTAPPSTTDADVCAQRLDKALDALEKAEKAFAAATNEIEARKHLDELKNQWIAVKDQMIKAQAELITFYDKQLHSTKSSLRKLLETAGKVALIVTGIMVGRGL